MKNPSDIQTNKTPELWTVKQLTERWQVTSMTLRRWRHAGKIKAHHLGRGIRFAVAEIHRIENEAVV